MNQNYQGNGLYSSTKVGGVVTFGKYDQDAFDEPIDWIVIERTNDYLLLLACKILDYRHYHEVKKTDVTWETSSLRQWLNTEFLNAAFTIEEQEQILEAPVTRGDNTKYMIKGGNETVDKVFILSIAEVEKYLKNDEIRKGPFTKITKNKSAALFSKTGWYWLRSPGFELKSAAGVKANGKLDLFGFGAAAVENGVRPAIRISLR